MFLCTPHLSPPTPSRQLSVSPHSLVLPVLLLSLPPKLPPPPPYQMSPKFGWGCACAKRAGTKGQDGRLGGQTDGWVWGIIWMGRAILPWAFCVHTISTIGLTTFRTHIHTQNHTLLFTHFTLKQQLGKSPCLVWISQSWLLDQCLWLLV